MKIQLPGRKPATPKTKTAAADHSAAAFSCADNNDRPVFPFCRGKLRRFADLLQEIFDHSKALIRGGTLSKTAEDFALMTADRAQQLRQEFLAALDQVGENAEQGPKEGSGKFSIKKSTEGFLFVDVDEDAIDLNDGRSIASVIAELLHDKFNNLISANGQKIQVNKTTNDEWRMSESAQKLKTKEPKNTTIKSKRFQMRTSF